MSKYWNEYTEDVLIAGKEVRLEGAAHKNNCVSILRDQNVERN